MALVTRVVMNSPILCSSKSLDGPSGECSGISVEFSPSTVKSQGDPHAKAACFRSGAGKNEQGRLPTGSAFCGKAGKALLPFPASPAMILRQHTGDNA